MPDLGPCDIRALIEDTLRSSGLSYQVESRPADRPWILSCDRVRLSASFKELAKNSRKACEGVGTQPQVRVTLEPWIEGAAAAGLRILFADNGPGVDPRCRGHLFEPFVSSLPSGHGLGLYTVDRNIRAHEGFIRLRPEQPGAVFEILLPGCSPEPT